MSNQGYQAGTGYRRLPRTIIATLLAAIAVIGGGMATNELVMRRTNYLRLEAQAGEIADRYAGFNRDESNITELAEADVVNLDGLARAARTDDDAELAASLAKMAEVKRREAERARGKAERASQIKSYYTTLRHRYQEAAGHPWRVVEPPAGDPLDVERFFLSSQKP